MNTLYKRKFGSKDELIHFLSENDLAQFAVVRDGDKYELAYIEEITVQPAQA